MASAIFTACFASSMTTRWPGTVETFAFAAAFLDSILSPIAAIAPGLGPTKTIPAFSSAREQESVAGIHRLRAGLAAGRDDLLHREIAFGGGRRADQNRFIGHFDVECVAIGLGIDRDRLYSHAAGRLDNPAGDLAAICDQDSFEHVLAYLQPFGRGPASRAGSPQSGTRGWM